MIRLLVADDHPIIREGLKRIVAECPDMTVVAEAVDGDGLLSLLADVTADVLLLDISMPGPGFLELMRELRSSWPDLRILIISAHPEDMFAVRSLRAGAAGYLSKDQSPDRLAEAIRRIHRGGRYVTPSLAEKLASELAPDEERPAHSQLSDREYQVLSLLGSGGSIKEIAEQLSLSSKTVSTYRSRVLEKLGLKTTADLIRYAIEHELTGPSEPRRRK
jgi:DNA-binding NarL/FixJ family response regulator